MKKFLSITLFFAVNNLLATKVELSQKQLFQEIQQAQRENNVPKILKVTDQLIHKRISTMVDQSSIKAIVGNAFLSACCLLTGGACFIVSLGCHQADCKVLSSQPSKLGTIATACAGSGAGVGFFYRSCTKLHRRAPLHILRTTVTDILTQREPVSEYKHIKNVKVALFDHVIKQLGEQKDTNNNLESFPVHPEDDSQPQENQPVTTQQAIRREIIEHLRNDLRELQDYLEESVANKVDSNNNNNLVNLESPVNPDNDSQFGESQPITIKQKKYYDDDSGLPLMESIV